MTNQPTTQTIDYYTKDVFGTTYSYLANPEAAKQWARLTGKLTLSTHAMSSFTALTGITFNRVFEAGK